MQDMCTGVDVIIRSSDYILIHILLVPVCLPVQHSKYETHHTDIKYLFLYNAYISEEYEVWM